MAAPMTDVPDYVDELDQLLLEQSEDCMLVTQLDGFLTGILVSPDLVSPGTWLKRIWAGDDGHGVPDFDDDDALQHFVDLIMHHYNQILTSLNQPGTYEPIFDIDTRTDEVLWEMWIEGFAEAMDLAPDGWQRVAASDDAGCKAAMQGGAKLLAIARGESRWSRAKQNQWAREAPDLIPIWVDMLHAWRLENDPSRPAAARNGKVGRNDPCPCGSDRKYKKCCGLN